MKKLKNIILLLLFITLFIGINGVKAISKPTISNGCFYGTDCLKARSKFNEYYKSKLNYNYYAWSSDGFIEKNRLFEYYEVTDGYGYYVAYCKNAGVHTGVSDDGGDEFIIDDQVFDSANCTSNSCKAHDAGILAILNKAGKNPSQQQYAATVLALRVFDLSWTNFDDNSGNTTGMHWINRILFKKWYSDSKNLLSQLDSQLGSGTVVSHNNTGFITAAGVYNNGTVYCKDKNCSKQLSLDSFEILEDSSVYNKSNGSGLAKDYYLEGLKAAIDFMSKSTIELKTSVLDNPLKVNGNVYTQTQTITISIKKGNYNPQAKLKLDIMQINHGSNPDSCTLKDNNSGKTYNLIGGTRNFNTSDTIDLISELNSNGKVEFTLTCSATDKTNGNAAKTLSAVQFTMPIEYKDDLTKIAAYKIHVKGTSKAQHYYMIYSDDIVTRATLSMGVQLISEDCTTNPNQPKCALNCTDKVSNIKCSEEDQSFSITEGHEIQNNNKCTTKSDQNVLGCIINNHDAAGNSYEATEILSNNAYCKVFCTEDFELEFPGIRSTNSGQYFKLGAKITGTKKCYTNKIDRTLFDSDLQAAEDEVKDAYNTWNSSKTTTNANELNSKIQKVNNIIEEYKACHNWSAGYNFDPKVEFDYEEDYMDNITNKTLETVGGKPQIKSGLMERCDKDVDDNYNCSSGFYNSLSGSNISVYNCEKNGSSYTCKNSSVFIYSALRVKQEITGEATFTTPNDYFYTVNFSGGMVMTNNPSSITNSNVINGLPVALKTTQGKYKYTLNVKDLGEYYDGSNKLGRVWGASNSVVTSVLKDTQSCGNNTDLKLNETVDGRNHNTGVYVCEYEVNIPYYSCSTPSESKDGKYHCYNGEVCDEDKYIEECSGDKDSCKTPSESSDGNYHCSDGRVCNQNDYNNECNGGSYKCEIRNGHYYYDGVEVTKDEWINTYHCDSNCPDCPVVCSPSYCKNGQDCCYEDCPDCPLTCKNCAYDEEANFDYREVSSEDLNPNNRELGANWNWDNNIGTALELKAYVTTEEIQSAGETIYENDFSGSGSDFAMKVTVDNKLVNKIRDYNDKNPDYLNNTLECYDYKNSLDGKTYTNVFCYSTFIDELVDELPNNIQFGTPRPRTKAERENTQNYYYFTTWDKASWTVTTTHALEYYKKNFNTIGIGPSWK